LLAGLDEKLASGIVTELVAENAETAGRISEAPGSSGGGDAVDEKSAQGLVMTVRRVAGLEECLGLFG